MLEVPKRVDTVDGGSVSRRNFEVLSPYRFMEDFVATAKQAKSRVWLQSMNVDNDEVFTTFSDRLRDAGVRGVDARFHIDGIALFIGGGAIDYLPSVSRRRRIQKRQARKEKEHTIFSLTDQGVAVDIVNYPNIKHRIFPMAGRNHIKIAIVDDVAWIGGLNLSKRSFSLEDIMIRIEDPRIVEAIADQFERINAKKAKQDFEIVCTDDTNLLVDVGTPRKSGIFQRALDLTNNASNSVRLATQFTLERKMLQAVRKAFNRKLETHVIVSEPNKIGGSLERIYDRINRYRSRLGVDIPIGEFPNHLHAKVLLVDAEDPTRAVVMVGSHNLLDSGVRVGTEEIMLQSSNPILIENLLKYFNAIEERSTLRKRQS